MHRNVLDFMEAWVEAGCVVCLVVSLCESGDLATQVGANAASSLGKRTHHAARA